MDIKTGAILRVHRQVLALLLAERGEVTRVPLDKMHQALVVDVADYCSRAPQSEQTSQVEASMHAELDILFARAATVQGWIRQSGDEAASGDPSPP